MSFTFPKNYSFLVDMPSSDDKQPSVSIIIPAHNEASVIAKTVEAVMKQNYPNFELWVMDDRSTDNTIEILTALQAKLKDDRFHFHTRPQDATPGKSAVLNDALNLTKGKLILVLDADGQISEQFLTQVVGYFKDENLGAVQVVKTIVNQNQNWLTQCQQVEYVLDISLQSARDWLKTACELRGNGQIVRRKAVMEVGGWTEYSVTDDLDLSSKFHATGWQIRFCQGVEVLEEGITKLGPLYKQRLRWAQGSIRRYLDYALPLAFSTLTRASIKWEGLGYSSTFFLPIVAALDLIWIILDPSKLLAWGVMWIVLFLSLAVIFTIELFKASYPLGLPTVLKAIVAAVYMVLVWPITVVQAVGTLLIKSARAPIKWEKTEHAG
jgi:1,2-diacylglycerol 3-beta-glucosyltransferase